MPNLIESMGAQYFNEKFANAHFLSDNRVYKVLNAQRVDRVMVEDVETGEDKMLAASRFPGFKVFEYPLLGYRRFADHVYGYAYKRQNTNRGFRLEHTNITWTGCTRLLYDLGVLNERLSDKQKAIALLKPEFDNYERDLPKLLNGEINGLVINHNLMIEPAVDTADGWYSVLYKQARVGKMNSRGQITYADPNFANVTGIQ